MGAEQVSLAKEAPETDRSVRKTDLDSTQLPREQIYRLPYPEFLEAGKKRPAGDTARAPPAKASKQRRGIDANRAIRVLASVRVVVKELGAKRDLPTMTSSHTWLSGSAVVCLISSMTNIEVTSARSAPLISVL